MRLCSDVYRLAILPGVLSLSFLSTGIAAMPNGGASFAAKTMSAEAPIVPEEDWAAEGDRAFNGFGYSVASAGDVDGDGYDDVVICTIPLPGATWGSGRLYLYRGSASGLETAPSWMYETPNVRSFFGYRLFPAGDLNNDGYDDIIVNEPRYYTGVDYEPRVYAFFGSPSGLGATPGWTVTGRNMSDFGWNIAAVGDVNGDGYSEVAIGERGTSTSPGRVHVYYGSTVLSTTADLILTATENFTFFGAALSSAGDVNGDGYDDLLVSEQNANDGDGRLLIFPGSSAGLGTEPIWTVDGDGSEHLMGSAVVSVGDINGDGYDDIMSLSASYVESQGDMSASLFLGAATAMSTTPVWHSRDKNLFVNRLVVAGAGDVDGDGYDDVIMGGHTHADSTDRTWLYLGSAQGLADVASKIMIDRQDSSYFGISVACAGDVNGDGYDDFMIGAPRHNTELEAAGRVIAYYGSATTTDVKDDRDVQMLYAVVAGNVLTADGSLAVNVQSPRKGAIQMEVFTVPGAAILHRSVEVEAGMQRVDVVLPGALPAGMYFARLSAAWGEVVTLPFSIVR